VFILFIKDFMNLTSSNKGLSIENALTQLQKGAPASTSPTGRGFGNIKSPLGLALKGLGHKRFVKPARSSTFVQRENGLVGLNLKNNQLLIKLISSTNSESLIRKRTRLSKIFGNKSLWAKIQNKIQKHNNSLYDYLRPSKVQGKKTIASSELIGKGALISPITKAKLNKMVG
jgi:hypothetical protein